MHMSVMLQETADLLMVSGGCYIDGTLGSGGHAEEILRRAGPEGRLLGIDRDTEALERARPRLAGVPGEACLVHGSHGDIRRLAQENGFGAVDAILLDTGVSSEQLDTGERGFSFRLDGPLDMRMDTTRGETAAGLLARQGDRELEELLRRLGEEPQARRIARAIVRERERAGAIETTGRLAEVVCEAMGRWGGPRHPATRVFQALRMAVNRELEELRQALEDGMSLLKPGGRIAVITFESQTDRLVKQRFAAHVGTWRSLQQGGTKWIGELPAMVPVTRKVVTPNVGEAAGSNPRARSAKLRVVARKE